MATKAPSVPQLLRQHLGISVRPLPAAGVPHIYITVFVPRIGAAGQAWAYVGKHAGYKTGDYLGSGTHLRRAVEKYGRDQFQTYCLEVVGAMGSMGQICVKEEAWLARWNCHIDKRFFNLSASGSGGVRVLANPEVKARWAASMKAMHADPEFRRRHAEHLKTMHADPEFKKRQVERLKAMHADPEFKKQNAKRLNAHNTDPDFKKRLSERMKARNSIPVTVFGQSFSTSRAARMHYSAPATKKGLKPFLLKANGDRSKATELAIIHFLGYDPSATKPKTAKPATAVKPTRTKAPSVTPTRAKLGGVVLPWKFPALPAAKPQRRAAVAA